MGSNVNASSVMPPLPGFRREAMENTTTTFFYSPHLCVGFLFLVVHSSALPARLPASRPPPTTCLTTQLVHTQLVTTQLAHRTTYSHTTCPHTTCPHTQPSHTQLVHTQLVTTQLTHTQLVHTQLVTHNLSSHTHNLSPHNLLTHNLSTHNLLTTQLDHHTTYSHTTCSTQLVHTQLVTTHNLSHTQLVHTQLVTTQLIRTQLTHTQLESHTTCSTHNLLHTQFVTTQLVTTQLTHTHNLSHAQLTHTQLVHTQLVTTQLTHTQFVTTQLLTTTGTHNLSTHNLSHTTCSHTTFSHTTCPHTTYSHTHTRLTHTQLDDICLHFACVRRGTYGAAAGLRGRRGPSGTWTAALRGSTWHFGHRPSTVCRPGVALGDIDRALCVAGVALLALDWEWWRAWVLWRHGRRGCLRGRCGTWRHRLTLRGRPGTWRHRCAFCVAGVALGDIDRHFAWQAWHLWHWTGTGGALGTVAAAVCVAGVALGDIDRHFAWKAWHLATSTCILRGRRGAYGTGLAGALGYFGRGGCLRGRRGTWRHRPSLCVAGVALGDIDVSLCVAGVALMALDWEWRRAWVLWSPRLFACQAWHLVTSTVAAWHLATSMCILVAGVALGDIDVHFAWQAWHLWHWTGTGGALGYFGRGSCLRGRREHIDRHFAWKAWHWATSTCILRRRRGLSGTGLVARLGTLVAAAVCVPGVALGDIDAHAAWQAWHLRHHITNYWRHRRAFCVAGVPFMA